MMKRLRRLVFALALLTIPVPAHAQILDIMDWIERMSGPALPGIWADLPLVCWYTDDPEALERLAAGKFVSPAPAVAGRQQPSIATKQQTVEKRAGGYPVVEAGPLARVDGLGRRRFFSQTQFLFPCSPIKVAYQGGSNLIDAAFVRRLVLNLRVASYNASHDGGGLLYGDNNLVYDSSVSEDDQVIHAFALGPSISWAVHRKVDLFWAFELNRFYGPAFESFWEPSIDALGLAYRPFDREDRMRILRFVQITVRVKKYLGTLRDVDFGAVPGTFHSHRESVMSLGLSYDISRLLWPRR